MPEKTINASDEDAGKGAVEQDRPEQKSNVSLAGQIGHRDQDPMLKAGNSDYGEPGQTKNTPAKRGPATRWIAIPNSLLRPLIGEGMQREYESVGADLDVALIRAVDVSNGHQHQRDQEAEHHDLQ